MAQRTIQSKRSVARLDGLKGFGLSSTQQSPPKRRRVESPIDLSIAENWSIRPELVSLFQDVIKNNLAAEHLSYSDSQFGDTKTMRALSAFFNEYFGVYHPVEPSQIALAPGSSSSLAGLLGQICDAGEGVLVPAPFWSKSLFPSREKRLKISADGFDFHFAVHAQVHPVVARLDKIERAFDADAILASLTLAYDETPLRTRALVLTNPGNPLGQCYDTDVLQRCAEFCRERDLHFICDEVYALSYFATPAESRVPFQSILTLDPASLGCDQSRMHMVWSLSKDFGCSGLRLGCVVSQANPDLILALRLPTSTEVSALTTLCAAALLTSPTLSDLVAMNKKRLADSYKAMTQVLEAHNIQYVPAIAGLFVFARLKPEATAKEEAEFVRRVRQQGLIISPGQAYHIGQEHGGWYRLTFSLLSEQLKKALAILDQCLANNK
ncbi:aminotransferase gliI [Aspergillus puulaauensis]|uniref:Putative secondary metabolism biosynthetic enzyme n=1 Tax=Aspergillus puulaauensis TaxID=1220207 RepID=A0A7R8AT47_9EURO|nr:putative secondary metabolism biosynthetic enzyme [Aspergillus puulaauensis]BCS28405.1 putative secondary metabolism biosynthetic enzyme [Aspergillus puulaauensis]